MTLTPLATDLSLRVFDNPLVTSVNGTLAALLVTVALVYWVTSSKLYRCIPILNVIPAVFLVYFMPMVLNTLGIFDAGATRALYGQLKVLALPLSLVLLLVGTDLPLIARLGPKVIAVMLFASVGIVVGGVVAFACTQGMIGDPDLWRGMGALAGSWIGGSANMIAAKEALECPQRVFTPMTVIDVACGYGWMIVVIALAGYQKTCDRWNRADTGMIEKINERLGEIHAQRTRPIKTPALLAMLAVGALVAHLCVLSGRWFDETLLNLPGDERRANLELMMTDADWTAFETRMAVLAAEADVAGFGALAVGERLAALGEIDGAYEKSATIAMRNVLRDRGADPTHFERPLHSLSTVLNWLAIALILTSLAGLLLSLTPLSRLEDSGASEVGYALLFIVLAAIGSRADLNEVFKEPAYLLLGTVWIAVFAVTLFLAIKIFRAPMFFVATASQANIGGVVSAPIVAGVYQPNLAIAGVLMAVIGQVVGTFLALLTGWLCSLIAIGG